MRRRLLPAAFAALALLAGCTSYEVRSRTRFVDELGRFAEVEYCVASKDHVTKFVSPANGKEFEMTSRLVVNVELYDEFSFRAFQTMNLFSSGTMYASDDGEWKFLANGFTCEAFHRNDETGRYDTKFQGVICRDEGAPKEDSKWKKVKPRQRGVRTETAK